MIRFAGALFFLIGSAEFASAQSAIEKLCILTAAQRLPPVPGLTITGSRIKTGVPPSWTKRDMNYFSAEIDINAANQRATFGFICGTSAQQQIYVHSVGILN